MREQMIMTALAIMSFTILTSFLVASTAYAQDTPYSEEYMRQHDGGDRAEYLQEMEHSDSSFYVPPTN
jgi:hypothetical protein